MNQSFTVLCLGLEAVKTFGANIHGYDVLKHYDMFQRTYASSRARKIPLYPNTLPIDIGHPFKSHLLSFSLFSIKM